MQQVFQQSKAFFSLDNNEKLTVKADKKNRGFAPMHGEMLDPKNQAKGDTKVRIAAASVTNVKRLSQALLVVIGG